MIFGPEIEKAEPSIRNSNLFPVNANGEVLFLSVVSLGILGNADTPISIYSVSLLSYSVLLANDSKIPSSSSPKKIEIIAGGASLAPSL